MSTLVVIIHVIVCAFLILTVLLQSGKGGMGALGSGGGGESVFGGGGASPFLKKLTAGVAAMFMVTSMTLAFFAADNAGDALEGISRKEQEKARLKDEIRKKALEAAGEKPAAVGAGGTTAPADPSAVPGTDPSTDPGTDPGTGTPGNQGAPGSGAGSGAAAPALGSQTAPTPPAGAAPPAGTAPPAGAAPTGAAEADPKPLMDDGDREENHAGPDKKPDPKAPTTP